MVATRSSTRKLPPKRAATPDSDSEASETEQQARPKKRVRVHRGNQGADDDQGGKTPAVAVKSHNRRRKLGRLAMMMSMPIDVFCEIALYLGPHDLLSMARTSKALRNLLMTKDSKPIWRAAEDSVGLPECPLDLSSPQYASFIYDTYCTHCFRTKGYNHLTPLRIRLCKTCMKENLQKARSWSLVCLDMPRNDKELSSVLMLVNGFPAKFTDEESIKSLRSFTYYLPQVKAALEKFRSFGRAYKQRKRYVDVCHEATCQRYLSSPALHRWLENTKEAKINEIQIAKDRRWRSIFIKLAELGYTEDDYQTQRDEKHWKWNSLIDQPRPLTDRIWKNIRPQLEETIRLRRELRTRLEKERCIKERQRKLAEIAKSFADSEEGKMCCIIHSDLLKLPIAKQILDSDEPGSDIPQVHQTTLKQQMVEMSKGRQLKLEEEVSSKVLSTRHAAGLKAFKKTDMAKLEMMQAEMKTFYNTRQQSSGVGHSAKHV
ncbi:hypothetical protein DFH11DRAFT_1543794 [Phellopilus nigrolimitatus]|nr:hypothetical protein DFH11DRAFT_1543794 [Phellopilus nigrolimitatus]